MNQPFRLVIIVLLLSILKYCAETNDLKRFETPPNDFLEKLNFWKEWMFNL